MASNQPLLDRVARVALAPAVPQPGESLPGSTPALSAGPLGGSDAPADKPWAQIRPSLLAHHLDDYGVGSIAEIFEGDPPFRPRGCIAQAWSVSEKLRAWLETAAERARMPATPQRTAKTGGTRRRPER